MKKIINLSFLLVVSAFFLSSCSLQKEPDNKELAPTKVIEKETATDKALFKNNDFSVSEVTQHNLASDCWLVVEGNVYDITQYIKAGVHPGGEALLKGCGQEDGTDLFNSQGNTGKSHSTKASSMLSKYFIGIVAD